MDSPEIRADPLAYPVPLKEPDNVPSADDQATSTEENESSESEQFVVEKVLAMKGDPPYQEFLIKWKEYSSEESTWEPLSGVEHIIEVQDYIRKHTDKNKSNHKRRQEELQRKRDEKRLKKKKFRASSSSSSDSDGKVKRIPKSNFIGLSNAKASNSSSFANMPIQDIRLKADKKRKKEQEKKHRSKSPVRKDSAIKRAKKNRRQSSSSSLSDAKVKFMKSEKKKKLEKQKERKATSSSSSSEDTIRKNFEPQKTEVKKWEGVFSSHDSSKYCAQLSTSTQHEGSPEIALIKPHPLKGVTIAVRDLEKPVSILFRPSVEESLEIPRTVTSGDKQFEDKKELERLAEKKLRKEECRKKELMEQNRKDREKEVRRKKAKEESRRAEEAEKNKRPPLPCESDSESGSDAGPQYEVDKCEDVKGTAPNREFLIKWIGYDSEDDTWEPESGVGHLEVVKEFLEMRAQEKHDSQIKKQRTTVTSSWTGTPLVPKPSKEGIIKNKDSDRFSFFDVPSKVKILKKPEKLNFGEGTLNSSIQLALKSKSVKKEMEIKQFDSNFRIPKTKAQNNVSVDENCSDQLDDLRIASKGFKDPLLFRMVMHTSLNPPQPLAVLVQVQTLLPGHLVSMPIVDIHRFDGLKNRIKYLMSGEWKFQSPDSHTKKKLVTRPDHVIETVFKLKETALAMNRVRINEVIASSSGYFRTLLEKYNNFYNNRLVGNTFDDKVSTLHEIPLLISRPLKSEKIREYLESRRGRFAQKEVQPPRRK